MDIGGYLQELPVIWILLSMSVSIVILVKGADWTIDGAVRIASRLRLSKIIIGATIVSLGTTTPEMVVSVTAAWLGNPALALGNGVGSIICDTGLIFGLSCIMSPIPIDYYILNRTGWAQVGAATLLVAICMWELSFGSAPPTLSRQVGFLFLVLLLCYLYASYRWARWNRTFTTFQIPGDHPSILPSLLLLCSGLGMVIAGSRILVPSASECARRAGVPEDVIAATMVAFGTSLPELMTAVSAVRKGHPEIMIGNVVGADVLNCLFVIGAAAAANPLPVSKSFFTFHFPAMLLILYSFRVFIFMDNEGFFKRWQGAWIFAIYLAYLTLQYSLG